MYLPVFVDEGKCKMNLGVVYHNMEDCLDFINGLGYKNRIEGESKMVYESDDGTYVEISIVEVR